MPNFRPTPTLPDLALHSPGRPHRPFRVALGPRPNIAISSALRRIRSASELIVAALLVAFSKASISDSAYSINGERSAICDQSLFGSSIACRYSTAGEQVLQIGFCATLPRCRPESEPALQLNAVRASKSRADGGVFFPADVSVVLMDNCEQCRQHGQVQPSLLGIRHY